MQMNNNEGCAAPYVSNSLYPSGPVYGDNGLTNAYDFNDHFGFNQGGKAQMSTLFGGPASAYVPPTTGTAETNLKDVPPSYTALFFAASDPSTGMSGKLGESAAGGEGQSNSSDTKVTNIQPIHLKVVSSAGKERQQHQQHQQQQGPVTEERKLEKHEEKQKNEKQRPRDFDDDDFGDDFLKQDRNPAPPVSLMSLESDSGRETSNDENFKDNNTEKKENPPPYNPGYNVGYRKF